MGVISGCMLDSKAHRYIFIFGTIVIAIALPFSPLLLSIGQFILAGNWLMELDFKRKFKVLISRYSIFIFLSIYLVHVLWLLNSSNMSYALHDLKIKLPIFALPLIFGTTQPLSRHEFKVIIHFFLASVLIATLVSLIVFLGLTKIEPFDYRNLSIFISHIRYALLIVLSIYILLSLLICFKPYQYLKPWVYITVLGWFICFLVFLGAYTGVIVLLLGSPFALLFWLNSKEGRSYKVIGTLVLSTVLLGVIIYLGISVQKYRSREIIDETKLEQYTANGNKYSHYSNNFDYENDERVWLYVCEKELKTEWEKRSSFKYDGMDKKGQFLRTTLIRYLTSMSVHKDSVGVSKLLPKDIEMIEKGYTNYIYKNRLSVYSRLYQLFWEIESYIKSGNPSGHSLTQRVEYSKNALNAIERHFWFGTGTGDVNDQIQLQYDIDKTLLPEQWQFRAHNQFITLFLTFGLIGFVFIISIIVFTLRFERSNIDFISFSFLLIVLFSMLNEDTFETQAGASFFAFFISLFIFGRKLSGD
jgi:hypothetical protein